MLSFIMVKISVYIKNQDLSSFSYILTGCLYFFSLSYFLNFKVLITFANTAIYSLEVEDIINEQGGDSFTLKWFVIFPLVFATVKRNLESRNTKT